MESRDILPTIPNQLSRFTMSELSKIHFWTYRGFSLNPTAVWFINFMKEREKKTRTAKYKTNNKYQTRNKQTGHQNTPLWNNDKCSWVNQYCIQVCFDGLSVYFWFIFQHNRMRKLKKKRIVWDKQMFVNEGSIKMDLKEMRCETCGPVSSDSPYSLMKCSWEHVN